MSIKVGAKKANKKNQLRAIEELKKGIPRFELKEYEAALEHSLKAYEYDPKNYYVLRSIVLCYYNLAKYKDATRYGEEAIKWCKKQFAFDLLSFLADSYNRSHDHVNGTKYSRWMVAVKPEDANGYNTLGVNLFKLYKFKACVSSYNHCLNIDPTMNQPYNNLSLAYKGIGDYNNAAKYAEKMSDMNKLDSVVFKNAITAYLYFPELPADRIANMQRKWIKTFAIEAKLPPLKDIVLDPNKKLRIGIVSSDLFGHPVGRNLYPYFSNLSRDHFEFYCYSNHPREDFLTERFKAMSAKWHDIHIWDDIKVARQIRTDKCDIVFFMCPFFDSNRALVGVNRCAPIQITFLDASRNLIPEMDYHLINKFIANPHVITDIGCERIVHLANFYQHPFLDDAPEISPLPSLTSPWFTYAIFNNPAKINEEVLAVWDAILANGPNIRLAFKYKGMYENPELQDKIVQGLPSHRPGQVMWHPTEPNFLEHLQGYADIDAQLDTWGFTASTTAFESLIMGAPILTLCGNSIMSRWCAGMLKQARMSDFICYSKDEYLGKALGLAEQREQLAKFRPQMRNIVKAKLSNCNPYFMARILRALWKNHCKDNGVDLNQFKVPSEPVLQGVNKVD